MKCLTCGNDIFGDTSYCSKCDTPADTGNQAAKTEEITQNIDTLSNLSFVKGEKFTDRYRILGELGQGGMGKVYKAEDLELGSIVALKMIHPELLKDDRMIKRFKKEILLAREISHENVVRIHDFGKKDHVQFVSMEYIEGKNLKEWLEDKKQPDLEQIVDFFKQICRGLQYAHKKGIVHRDLKPQNIMVDKNRKAIITDFGLAMAIDTKDLSQSGTAIGTPEYISPEQAIGDEITHRVDIYSLGLIIYELITGIPPFQSSTAYGYLHKHAYSKPTPPSQLNRLISPYLENIVFKCLKKNPSDRYASTEDILLDLDDERILTPTGLISYWGRRILKYAGIAAALGIIILISHFILLRTTGSSAPVTDQSAKKTIAVMYFENMTGDKNMNHWRKAFSELLINDLSQSKYLNVVSGDRLYEILSDMDQVEAQSYSARTLRKVAEKANATYIVRGTYAKDQKGLRLNIDLRDISNRRSLGTDQVTCRDRESYFDMIDRVTDRLKPRFRLTDTQIAGDINRSVSQITTASLEALSLYIEAREMYQQQQYHGAIRLLEEAVKIDPDFAMAYKSMATYHDYIGNFEKYQAYLRKSLSLVDRISLRERFLIEGFSENVLNNSPWKAVEKFEKLLETYPDDIETRILLGAIYRNFEQWERMKYQFERIIQINKNAPWAHYNLVLVLCATGKYDEAEKLLLENPDAFHNQKMYLNFLAKIHLCRHNKEGASKEIEKALAIESNNYKTLEAKTKCQLIYGENIRAENTINQIIQNKKKNAKATGHYLRCHLYLHQGKIRDCLEEIDLGIQLSKKWHLKYDEQQFNLLGIYVTCLSKMESRTLAYLNAASEISSEINRIKHEIRLRHYEGMAYLTFNHMEKAKMVLGRIKTLSKAHQYKKIKRVYHHLKALQYMKKGDYKRAIQAMNKSIPLLNSQFRDTYDYHALHLNTLGKLYYRKGDYKDSAIVFKQITDLTAGRIHFGDIYAKSYFWLGNISQQEGKSEDAIKFYKKFLEIWKDADPDIPEISEARKKITQL